MLTCEETPADREHFRDCPVKTIVLPNDPENTSTCVSSFMMKFAKRVAACVILNARMVALLPLMHQVMPRVGHNKLSTHFENSRGCSN